MMPSIKDAVYRRHIRVHRLHKGYFIINNHRPKLGQHESVSEVAKDKMKTRKRNLLVDKEALANLEI